MGYLSSCSQSKQSKNTSNGRLVKFLGILFAVMLTAGLSACSGTASSDSNVKLAETGEASQQLDQTVAVSYTVVADDWKGSASDYVLVEITGQDSDGKSVLKKTRIVPGTESEIELKPGIYEFSLSDSSPAIADTVYSSTPVRVTINGDSGEVVTLNIAPDEIATQALLQEKAEAEAAQKAAEEEAAAEAARIAAEEQAAAEAKAQEEARIAAEVKAAADAQTKAQAQSSAKQSASSSSDSGGGIVYVAASGNGECYHTSPSCSRMKGTNSMTVAQAKAAGYRPCSKCC